MPHIPIWRRGEPRLSTAACEIPQTTRYCCARPVKSSTCAVTQASSRPSSAASSLATGSAMAIAATEWAGLTAFGLGIAAGTIGWAVGQAVWTWRAKIAYVDV